MKIRPIVSRGVGYHVTSEEEELVGLLKTIRIVCLKLVKNEKKKNG